MKRDEQRRMKRIVTIQGASFALAVTPLLALADPDLLVPLAMGVSLPGLAISTAANVAFHRMQWEPDVELADEEQKKPPES